MTLIPFKHLNVTSIEEAVSLLDQYKNKAALIAGGTDLLGALKDNIHPDYPEILLNIKNIKNLAYIKESRKGLKIGALTKLQDIEANPVVKEKYRVLSEAARSVASPQIRDMGTIGGNICQEVRCWYYRNPENRFYCMRKGGKVCNALTGENRYHSIFGAARVVIPPCSSDCPTNVNIPSYLSEVRKGDLDKAARLLLENNPIPAITGRVCPHFCEQGCNRHEFDESVSVRCVERFLGDYILENATQIAKSPNTETSKSIAIVGSGPAGLSAAYYLRKLGHSVTVFEKLPEAGGMLTYSIPPYRLPKSIVKRQVKVIEDMGVKFKVNSDIKSRSALKQLMKDYDAVLLATGAWVEKPVGIKGEEFIMSGMEFLNRINSGKTELPGKKVGVIGGGNVAIDVARTLLRLGAQPVIIYRRSISEMPAIHEEVEKAKEEGIKFEFLAQPLEAEKKGKKIILGCIRMKLGALDASGRPSFKPITGSEFTIEFDAVFKAIGEGPNTSYLPAEFVKDRGQVKHTSEYFVGKNLFAGGDFVTGPSTVVQCIAAGRKTASLINEYFNGGTARPAEEVNAETGDSLNKCNSSYLKIVPRIKVPELPISERTKSIEVEDTLGLNSNEVATEANRCFDCGCVAVNPSDVAPALVALEAKIKTTNRIIEAEKFFVARLKGSTILDQDELVTEIQIPAPKQGSKQAFLKFRLRKAIDFPIVAVACIYTINYGKIKDIKIALGAVAPIPLRAKEAEKLIKNKELSEEIAEAASLKAVKNSNPLVLNDYKVDITRALVRRAILTAR